MTSWIVGLEVVDSASGKVLFHGRTRNISEDGIGVHCRQKVAFSTNVRLYRDDREDPEEHVEGEVIHCTGTVGGFKIGIRVKH